jgi:hypothetical protein
VTDFLGTRGTIGERAPGGLGTAATLAHMVERSRFRIFPRLLGAGEIELELGGVRHAPKTRLRRPAPQIPPAPALPRSIAPWQALPEWPFRPRANLRRASGWQP